MWRKGLLKISWKANIEEQERTIWYCAWVANWSCTSGPYYWHWLSSSSIFNVMRQERMAGCICLLGKGSWYTPDTGLVHPHGVLSHASSLQCRRGKEPFTKKEICGLFWKFRLTATSVPSSLHKDSGATSLPPSMTKGPLCTSSYLLWGGWEALSLILPSFFPYPPKLIYIYIYTHIGRERERERYLLSIKPKI